MGCLAKLRQWINRDDGRLFRVGNEAVGMLEVAIVLGVIVALLLLQVWRIG